MRVLLLSGGLESTALCYLCRPEICLTVDYGQPSFAGECRAASFFCCSLGLQHSVAHTDAYDVSSQPVGESWWPFRNQLLLTTAAAATYHLKPLQIMIGLVKEDIYSDCSATFLESFNDILAAQGAELKVVAPAIEMTTDELLVAAEFPVDALEVTFSCHHMSFPCGSCLGCQKSRVMKDKYRQINRNRSKAASAASR